MTVKIEYVYLGHAIGGDIQRSLVLNTRKFSEAAAYCKNVLGMTARAVLLDKGSKIFEMDTPDDAAPMIEAWARDAYPIARAYCMEHAPAAALNEEGAANGSI